jgi:hypothetical protein
MAGSGLIISTMPLATPLGTLSADFATVPIVAHAGLGTGISMNAQSGSTLLRLFNTMSAYFF